MQRTEREYLTDMMRKWDVHNMGKHGVNSSHGKRTHTNEGYLSGWRHDMRKTKEDGLTISTRDMVDVDDGWRNKSVFTS